MTRRLPSLNALRAFEVAARHLSFTRAADELAVTQGAVSHQVKALERQLGVALFNRQNQRLTLTSAGQGYLPVVRDAFDRIAAGTEQLLANEQSKRLTISVSPNFAANWLVPRIGHFVEQHPEIDLRINAALHHVDFAREDVDMAVRHGDGHWPDLHVVRLCREELFPACSPKLLEGPHPLRAPPDLHRHTLLHLDDRSDWQKWLDAAGVDGIDLSHGVVFNQASMAIRAAVDGQGVTLARTALATLLLLEGRLVRPFPLALPVSYGYWIVCPQATAGRPKIALMREWLLAEATADEARLAGLGAAPSRPPERVPAPLDARYGAEAACGPAGELSRAGSTNGTRDTVRSRSTTGPGNAIAASSIR
jgi:LysR family transcriptional regulator, glycine cleavage system transcriptional activator